MDEFEEGLEPDPNLGLTDTHAALRRVAANMGDLRRALMGEGFTQKQAAEIVLTMTALGVFVE